MAIEIKKEKNLIYFQDTEKTKPYTLDLNTMTFYGLSGKVVLRNPISRRIEVALNSISRKKITYLDEALRQMFCNEGSYVSQYKKHKEELLVADSLTNAKVPYVYICNSDLLFIKKNMKEFREFIARIQAGESLNVRTFFRELNYNKFLKEYNLTADIISMEEYENISNRDIIKKNISHYCYAIHRAYLKEFMDFAYGYSNSYARNVLQKYYEECEMLGKEPVKINNLVREIVETHRQYELRKQEFDTAKMKQNYEKQAKAFDFTYGDYTIVVPKTPTDIIDEGNNMHHCVGSYIGDVVNNYTYIVFVRHKDTPDKCYITAQVRTNGTLGQYYLAYDHRVSNDTDLAFKRAFAEHLAMNWVKE